MNRSIIALAVAGCLLSAMPAAQAQAPSDNVEQVKQTLLSLIRALVDQGVLTPTRAQEMLRQAGLDPALLTAPTAPAAPLAADKPVVRVPYVPEVVKEQLRDEIKQEVLTQARAERWGDPGSLPEWLNRISVYGDVRLRYQGDRYDEGNDPPQNVDFFYQLPDGTTRNTTEDRDRLRLRARLGLNARLSEQFRAGVRITTDDGSGNPTSTNVDLGRYETRYATTWDLAFLQWDYTPTSFIAGGRIANPYYSTDLIWAPDLTFDGIAATYKPRLSLTWEGFMTAGAHPLREVESGPFTRAGDQWLYAFQAGAGWTGADSSNFKFALSYYDFSNVEGELNPDFPTGNAFYNAQTPSFRRRGNTMFNVAYLSSPGGTPVYGIASKFRVASVAAQYELARYDPVRVSINGEWLNNLGFDADDIRTRIGPAIAELPLDKTGATGVERKRTKAYRLGMQVGRAQVLRLSDWQAFGGYRYLERDAVLDGLTSGDYRLGGTDQKAYFLGLNYGLATNAWLQLRYVSARSLDAAVKYDIDTWYLDFNGRF